MESPIKGIDTVFFIWFIQDGAARRIDHLPPPSFVEMESPIKRALLKKKRKTMIKSPFKAVKW